MADAGGTLEEIMRVVAGSNDQEFENLLKNAPPALYLKALQARYLLGKGFPISLLQPEGYKEVMKENEAATLERLKRHFEELYPRDSVTPDEFYRDYSAELLGEVSKAKEGKFIADPFTTNMILRMGSQIQRALEERYPGHMMNIVLGVLPTGRINAMTIHVPGGGEVVAVNEGAIIFIHLVCRLLSVFVTAGTQDGGMLFKLTWPT